MAIFTESALRGIIKHKTNANDFTENIPITHSSAVVVDNEAEEFLDTRLISLNNDIDKNKTNITSLDDQLNAVRLLASGKTSGNSIKTLDAEYSNIVLITETGIMYRTDSTGRVVYKEDNTDINEGSTIDVKCVKLGGIIGNTVFGTWDNEIRIIDLCEGSTMGYYKFGVDADVITSIDAYNIGPVDRSEDWDTTYDERTSFTVTLIAGTATGKVGIVTAPISIASPRDVDFDNPNVFNDIKTPFGATNVNIITSLITSSQALFLSANGYVLYDYLDNAFVGEGTTGVISNLVDGALMPDEKTAVIGSSDGNVYKFDMTQATVVSTYSSGRKPAGSTLVGIDTDNAGNVYIMYSNGTLRKLDSSFNFVWDYISTTGTPTAFTTDRQNGIGVIGYSNGNFDILRVNNDTIFTAFTEIACNVENTLMPIIDYLREGSAIQQISVCQLSGDINITGDVTGTVTLDGSNWCRYHNENGHTHAISISSTLSPNAKISKTISSSDNIYQVTNKQYVDSKTTVMRGATTSVAGLAGLVPAPSTSDTTKFLRGDGTWVVPNDTTYTHPTVSVNNTTSAVSPTHGGTFTTIASVTTNTGGHVTGLNTRTVTLPSYSTFTTSANGLVPSSGSSTSQYLRGDGTWATPTNTVYTHPSYTTSKTTSTATATHGGTFTVIDSLTTNSTGHVTALNTKTVTLPADNNTDEKVKMVATEGNGKFTIRKFPLLLAPNTVTDGTSDESYYVPEITLEIDDQFRTYTITGNISGSASTASKLSTGTTGTATTPVYFSNGIPVATTYSLNATVPSNAKFTDTTYSTFTTTAAGLVPAGGTGTTRFLRQDGTWVTPNDTVLTYNNFTGATSTDAGEPGLVPAPAAGDQLKFLRADATWVVPYTHPTYTSKTSDMYKVTVDSTGHVSATTKVTKADITALGIPAQDTTYSVATTSTNGLMSSTDKTKLDAVPTPSTIATKTDVNNAFAANDAMTYKGVISSTATSPGTFTVAANAGDTYKVSTSGYVNGTKVEAGDMLICCVDGTAAASATTYSTIMANWNVVQTNIDGAVTGPATAQADRIATFADSTGKVIKNSGFTIETSVPANAKFTDTTYTHPSYTSRTSDMYKITVNTGGHVSAATKVTKADITALGIPAQDTTYDLATSVDDGLMASTDKDKLDGYPTVDELFNNIYEDNLQLMDQLDTLRFIGYIEPAWDITDMSEISSGTHYEDRLTPAANAGDVYFMLGSGLLMGHQVHDGDLIVCLYDDTPEATRETWTSVERSWAFITDTVYTHPTYTSKTSDMYKVTVDGTGHVSATTKITKSDITALGIPAQDTTYDLATITSDGLMSSDDKSKLDEVPVPSDIVTSETLNGAFDEISIELDHILTNAGLLVWVGGLVPPSDITDMSDPANVTPYENRFTPEAMPGHAYVIGSDGLLMGRQVHYGDLAICMNTTEQANDDNWMSVVDNWVFIQGLITDNVTSWGGSSTEGGVAVFGNTSGRVIMNSGFTIESSVPANAEFTDTKVQMDAYDNNNLETKQFSLLLAPDGVIDGTSNASVYVPELTVEVNHDTAEYTIDADISGNAQTATKSYGWFFKRTLTLKDKNTNSLGSVSIDGTSNVDLTMNMIYSETEPADPTQGMIWFKPLSAEPDNSAYTVSSTEPTDTGKLWVDTSDNNILKFYDGTTWSHVGSAYS